MKAPFFTVLIDSYNYGRYVEEAVSSALAQGFPPEEREILVVDDGSADDTAARLRKLEMPFAICQNPMADRLPRLITDSSRRVAKWSRCSTPTTCG
jgi:glycosyltransferase involved in cell wall biosynthesis